MNRTATIKARTDFSLKQEVDKIFAELGLTTSGAINLFLQQVRLHRGLPFNVEIPNDLTVETFRKTDAGIDLIECDDTDDMFRKLGI